MPVTLRKFILSYFWPIVVLTTLWFIVVFFIHEFSPAFLPETIYLWSNKLGTLLNKSPLVVLFGVLGIWAFLGGAGEGEWIVAGNKIGFKYIPNSEYEEGDKPFQIKSLELEKTPFTELRLFKKGRDKLFSSILNGKLTSCRAFLFHYDYCLSDSFFGKSHRQKTISQFVLLVESSKQDWPLFYCAKKKWSDSIKNLFKKQSSDFNFSPTFKSLYKIEGKNASSLIESFFHEKNRIDELIKNPSWNIEASKRWLIIYQEGKEVDPSDLEEKLLEYIKIAQIFSEEDLSLKIPMDQNYDSRTHL